MYRKMRDTRALRTGALSSARLRVRVADPLQPRALRTKTRLPAPSCRALAQLCLGAGGPPGNDGHDCGGARQCLLSQLLGHHCLDELFVVQLAAAIHVRLLRKMWGSEPSLSGRALAQQAEGEGRPVTQLQAVRIKTCGNTGTNVDRPFFVPGLPHTLASLASGCWLLSQGAAVDTLAVHGR